MNVTFTERWLKKERELGLDAISEGVVINGSYVLPADASPFLSFKELERMPRIQEVFNLDGWSDAAVTQFEPYRMIGSDGAGNPICVDSVTGQVWIFDHEAHFKTRQFVNSSIEQLAESLLVCLGEDKADVLIAGVAAQDPDAAREGTFWWSEANNL